MSIPAVVGRRQDDADADSSAGNLNMAGDELAGKLHHRPPSGATRVATK